MGRLRASGTRPRQIPPVLHRRRRRARARQIRHTPSAPPQEQMIRAMVERLAARLQRTDPTLTDGSGSCVPTRSWAKREGARGPSDARRALQSEPEKLRRFEEARRILGVPQTSAPTTSARNSPSTSAPPQDEMIRAMVERLAARLQQDGSDPDGSIRLLRSYVVLGESEKARAALTDARRVSRRTGQTAPFRGGCEEPRHRRIGAVNPQFRGELTYIKAVNRFGNFNVSRRASVRILRIIGGDLHDTKACLVRRSDRDRGRGDLR